VPPPLADKVSLCPVHNELMAGFTTAFTGLTTISEVEEAVHPLAAVSVTT
jgi:hypothetical protein